MSNTFKTKIFTQLPWEGGLNTSLDESMIPSNQLIRADNVIFDTRGSRKKREGIKHNWDSATTGNVSIVGMHDYWYGNSLTRSQKMISVMSDRTVHSYDSSGTKTALTVGGTAWSGTLTSATMITFGNILIIAVSGANNVLKYWDGTNAIQDVPNSYGNNCLTRASSGTTRTLVFKEAFGGTNGSTVIVYQAGSQSYNGTFTVTSVSTTTVANDTITYTASSSLTEGTTADTSLQVGSNQVPKASFMREHLGRIFCNDKDNPDNLHYSSTGDYTVWFGYGDSGAFPIVQGDGDPAGVNGIFPTFKNVLFVAKKTKLYRIDGIVPEEFAVTKVSDGIGVVSHASITAIDQDDVFFVSEKGVHGLATTANYGDFSASFISKDIQQTFNQLNKSREQFITSAYLSNINSVAFTFSSSGSSTNDLLYLYNIQKKAWYKWTTGLSHTSLLVMDDADMRRLYLGTTTGRISKTQTGVKYDVSQSGTNTAVNFHITTGIIYPDGNAYTNKGFKRLIVYYKPQNAYTMAITVKIDSTPLSAENSLDFSDHRTVDLLGTTFILGSSILGYSVPMGAYSRTIDGYGRGCKIEITSSDLNSAIEIQGIGIEYEDGGFGFLTNTNT